MSFVFPESFRKSQERITYNLLNFSKYLPCQFFFNFNTFAITTLVNMFKTLIVLEQLVIPQLDIQYVFKFHYKVLPTTFLFILQCFCNKNFSKHIQNFYCHKMVCKSFAVVLTLLYVIDCTMVTLCCKSIGTPEIFWKPG